MVSLNVNANEESSMRNFKYKFMSRHQNALYNHNIETRPSKVWQDSNI